MTRSRTRGLGISPSWFLAVLVWFGWVPGFAAGQESVSTGVLAESRDALEGFLGVLERAGRFERGTGEVFLGPPLRVKMVILSELGDPANGVNELRSPADTGILWFPVFYSGKIWAQLEVVKVNGVWVGGRMGGGSGAAAIVAAMQRLPETLFRNGIVRHSPFALVRVSELNATLLFFEAGGRGWYIPAMVNAARLGMKDRKLYSESEARALLLPWAPHP